MASVIQPQGSSSFPGELTSLQNSRYKVVTKEPISTSEVIPPKILALGTAYSTIYTVDSDETAFANLKLISQYVAADTVNRAQALVLVREFQTLTNAFVAELDDQIDYDLNGLKRVTRTLIAEAGTSTAAFVVGTQSYSSSPTLYLARLNIEENDAFVRIRAEYLQPGIVSTSERLIDGGLKEVTVRSFYNQNAPSVGIKVSQTEENENGYPIWVTTVLQKSDGTSPTSAGAALTLSTLVNFTYPGRAKPYTNSASIPTTAGTLTWNFYDVYLSPPIESTIDATTEISYATTNTIGALTNPLWNPTEWATVKGYWINTSDQVRQRIEGLRGYRTAGGVSDATDPSTVSGTAQDPTRETIFGEPAYFSSGFSITVQGGPAKPDGNTYTLSYRVEDAFTDTAGTKYYRKTITYATIPAQDALPV